MSYGVIAGLIIIILVQLIYAHHLDERRREYADSLCNRWIAERDGWHIDRLQLLERIQESNYTKVGYESLEAVVSKERDAMMSERRDWMIERQSLLDRIQSPTFAEYKHQEVKVIKAKNGTDKPDVVIEQL